MEPATDNLTQRPRESGLTLHFAALFAIAFTASAATMMVEMAAGRIIARHLGASIYTWTSVIGVVLAGLATGNYIGGLVADRRESRRALAAVLLIAAGSCGLIPILDVMAAGWPALWLLSWPARTAAHVSIGFFMPAMALGLVAPILVKVALDQGIPRGRAVGGLSAAGALGSIVGTFLAGFTLISTLGSIGLVCSVSGLLLMLAIGIHPVGRLVWIGAILCMIPIGFTWTRTDFQLARVDRLAFWRPQGDTSRPVLFATESDYSYVEVSAIEKGTRKRAMRLDSLVHSEIDLDDTTDLLYDYHRIFAAVLNRCYGRQNALNALIIGGGGYVFPRFIIEQRPESTVDVVEIDPVVTEAAYEGFAMPRTLPIRIAHEDGRVFVRRELESTGAGQGRRDVVFIDALNGFQVPHQLTTLEFLRACNALLNERGALLANTIDIFESGEFIASLVQTLRQVFPYVYMLHEPPASEDWRSTRSTFVIVGLKQPLDTTALGADYDPNCIIQAVSASEVDTLMARTTAHVLTDEYAPVENLLAPVVRQAASDRALADWVTRIHEASLARGGAAMLERCDQALQKQWTQSQRTILLRTKMEALQQIASPTALTELIEIWHDQDRSRTGDSKMKNLAAVAMLRLQRFAEALPLFEALLKEDGDAGTRAYIVSCLIALERYEEAIPHCEKLVAADPTIWQGYDAWITCLQALGRPEKALQILDRAQHSVPLNDAIRSILAERRRQLSENP